MDGSPGAPLPVVGTHFAGVGEEGETEGVDEAVVSVAQHAYCCFCSWCFCGCVVLAFVVVGFVFEVDGDEATAVP